MNAVVFEIS